MTSIRESRVIAIGFAIMLVTTIIYLADATWSIRGIYGDGLHLGISMAIDGRFGFSAPSRVFSHMIIKFPVVQAVNLGLRDVHAVLVMYSATLLFFPLIAICLSYFALPRTRKYLFVLPVLAYLTGITASSFQPIGEAQFGTAYFWPLAFLLLFADVETPMRKILLAVLCLPTLLMHESYSFLGLLLLGVTCYRAWRARDAERIFWLILALWFVAVIATMVYHVIYHSASSNKEGFINSTLKLAFLIKAHRLYLLKSWSLNGPAVAGLVGLAAGLVIAVAPDRRRLHGLMIALVAVVGLAIAVDVFTTQRTFHPGMQTAARAHVAFISVGLFFLMLLALWRYEKRLIAALPSLYLLIAVLSVPQMVWHLGATDHWRNSLAVLCQEVERHEGLVAFEDTRLVERSIDGRPIRRMWRHHTVPKLSLLCARDGVVRTIIAAREGANGRFDPTDPSALPKIPGYDYGPYLATLDVAAPTGD